MPTLPRNSAASRRSSLAARFGDVRKSVSQADLIEDDLRSQERHLPDENNGRESGIALGMTRDRFEGNTSRPRFSKV